MYSSYWRLNFEIYSKEMALKVCLPVGCQKIFLNPDSMVATLYEDSLYTCI